MEFDCMELFDAIVVSHDDDADEVSKFIDLLRVNASKDKELIISGLTEIIEMQVAMDKFGALQAAFNNSTFILIFISQNYVASPTSFDEFVKSCCLDSFIHDQSKKNCIIPIWVDFDGGVQKPFGVCNITGCPYFTDGIKQKQRYWNILKKKLNMGIECRLEKERERGQLQARITELEEKKKQLKHEQDQRNHEAQLAALKLNVREMPGRPQPTPRTLDQEQVRNLSRLTAGAAIPPPTTTNVVVNINLNQSEPNTDGYASDSAAGKYQPPAPLGEISDTGTWNSSLSDWSRGSTFTMPKTSGVNASSQDHDNVNNGMSSIKGSSAELTSSTPLRHGNEELSSQPASLALALESEYSSVPIPLPVMMSFNSSLHSTSGVEGVPHLARGVEGSSQSVCHFTSSSHSPHSGRRVSSPTEEESGVSQYASDVDLPSNPPDSFATAYPLTLSPDSVTARTDT